ncbi:MAG: TolC family protein [Rhodobacterales bacterium]|nr:TolC family protein [Rhodobacterales bacterium]
MLAVGLLTSGPAWAGSKTVVVVTDGPVTAEEVDPFVSALRDIAGPSLVQAEDVQVIAGDWTVSGVEAALEKAYDQSPDLVLAVGWGASTVTAHKDTVAVPTVAPWILDPVLLGKTDAWGENVFPVRVHVGMRRFVDSLSAVTGATRVALLLDPMIAELLGAQTDVEGLFIVTLGDAPDTLEIPPDVDAVLVSSLQQYPDVFRTGLAARLAELGLPSFSLDGVSALDDGFMMTHKGLGDPTPIARSAALLAAAVLQGSGTVDAVWTPSLAGQRVIQAEVMSSLGVVVPFDVLLDAQIVGDANSDRSSEGLDEVVALAVVQSPDLRASQAEVDAARSDLIRSWSNWMPQVGVSATAAFVDDRVADASLGLRSPAQFGMDAGLHQLLYDDMARASIPIQQRLQAGRIAGFDARVLDVVYDVSVTYVSALRADAMIGVRQVDLASLQANLEAARVRVAVGDATDAEEARWQAEIAQARANLVDAYMLRRTSEMRVNQLVGRKPGVGFRPDPEIADDLLARFRASAVGDSLDDPLRMRRLADALVGLGQERSPELAQMDLGINAQEAYLGATRRTYFVPQVGANVTGTWNAWRSQGSQGALNLSGLGAGVDLTLPQMPSTYATAGVSASLPIFEGRARIADQSEATYDLARMASQRLQLEQRIELRIRTAVLGLEASYQRVKMAKISAAGAQRNLEWAQDAYARGVANQVQLLDARAESLQAGLGLADSRYGFLAAILETKRATALLSHPGSPVDEETLERTLTTLLSEEPK